MNISRSRAFAALIRGLMLLAAVVAATAGRSQADTPAERIAKVAGTKGLVAFWDFTLMEDGLWTSHFDPAAVDRRFPVVLRRIGDPKSYAPADWPYDDDDSKLLYDDSGPFGRAVRFNQGFIFAEVPRSRFDRTALDLHGRNPFTLIAWTKFIGKRHFVTGIWDEGGWQKYGGRRQAALFGGLFGSQGVVGHISATGAASYPQSSAPGSQYARLRAIDGRAFENGRWVAMAMTFRPDRDEVTVYCNGKATPTRITDPVAQDVYQYAEPVSSNPFTFTWPVFSPRKFIVKFNGYRVSTSGVYEHWLQVDVEAGRVIYDRAQRDPQAALPEHRVRFDVLREGRSLLPRSIERRAEPKSSFDLPAEVRMQPGDEIATSLWVHSDGQLRRVGDEVRYRLREGAPFTFGRALGLGDEPIAHGAQLCLDGVAVFNRALNEDELTALSFHGKQ